MRPWHDWENEDRVWVNDATDNGWGVYTFTRPWVSTHSTQANATVQTASSQLKGGLYVEKSVLIGSSGNLTITSGTITVSNNSSNVVFQPSATKAYDIGTSDKVFRNKDTI